VAALRLGLVSVPRDRHADNMTNRRKERNPPFDENSSCGKWG